MAEGYAELARVYDPNNVQVRIKILQMIYEGTRDARGDPELLAFEASFVYRTIVVGRELLDIDLCTLTFPITPPPLASWHPVVRVGSVLDQIIENKLKFLSTVSRDNTEGPTAASQLHASLIWKVYLLALNTQPRDWLMDAVYALGSLAVLTTAETRLMTPWLQHPANDPVVRQGVREGDWPPQAFVHLYSTNRALIEARIASKGRRQMLPEPPSFEEAIEQTKFNIWLSTQRDPALHHQAQEHAKKVGNPSAEFKEYERLMYLKWKRPWWRRLLGG